jgi:hypothetical protein
LLFSQLDAHTLRGSGADLVIAEEFAHMHPNVFYEVIAPTLVSGENGGTIFIAITTPGNDLNYTDKVISAVNPETGKLVFNVIPITLVCDDCKEAGKMEQCIHRAGEIPYWHDSARHVALKAVSMEVVTLNFFVDHARKRRRLHERNKGY